MSYVGDSNMFIAAAVGGLKDGLGTLGYRAEAPILERADFEHLDAQGRLQNPPRAYKRLHRHTFYSN